MYVCFVLLTLVEVCLGKSRSELTQDLMRCYDKKIRPSKVYEDTVKVKFELYLNQLLDVNEVSQKIETKLFVSHIWKDPRLEWNPTEYEGIKSVHISAEKLWFPIFVLYNNADGDFGISKFTKAKVSYTGEIDWKPPAIYKSFCQIEVADFPFDTQNCTMKIGPWSDHSGLIDMVNNDSLVQDNLCTSPRLDAYVESGEWSILKVGCYKHFIKYDCCDEIYIDFTYYFILQRRPLYLIINILFPTMLFSLLTCAVFYLPSDAGEKMTLSISLLLSLIVFLLVIVEAVPSTANGIPLLCKYITFTMILVSLSIMITVVVLNVHYRGPATHIMSDRIRKIFMLWLPKFMFSSTMKRLDPYEHEKNLVEEQRLLSQDITKLSGQDFSTRPTQLIGNDVRQAADGVNFVADYFKDQRESQRKEDEWKYVAMVLDHFLLYIFIAACVFGTIFIFGERLLEFGREVERFKNNKHDCLLGCSTSN